MPAPPGPPEPPTGKNPPSQPGILTALGSSWLAHPVASAWWTGPAAGVWAQGKEGFPGQRSRDLSGRGPGASPASLLGHTTRCPSSPREVPEKVGPRAGAQPRGAPGRAVGVPAGTGWGRALAKEASCWPHRSPPAGAGVGHGDRVWGRGVLGRGLCPAGVRPGG